MEQYWTKRKLIGLSRGDTETVRQWQSHFGRFIYTWLYYQLNKDESLASTLTAQTLSQALKEIAAFEPEQMTMYLWLKELALQQLQSAMSQSGVKIQRPFAWSEIPPSVIDALKRIRTEPLTPEAAGYGAVIEMVQAVLSDLSEQDRELLVRRYTRLDTIERIASELNLTGDKVNEQLYLARHAFRRGLFCLIQSVNPDFSEPSASGGLELFESNLETLLRSVNASAVISSGSAEQIKRAILDAASDNATRLPLGGGTYNNVGMKVLAGFVLAAAALVLFLWIGRGGNVPSGPDNTELPPTVQVKPDAGTSTSDPHESKIDPEELKRVMDLGIQGNVAGLLNVLKTGNFVMQMTAAHYLGQLGDETMIEPLLEAMRRWYPDGPEDNQFARAVFEITERLNAGAAVDETVVVESPKSVEEPDKPAVSEVKKTPLLSGKVMDFDGSPLSGVQISIQREPRAGSLPPQAKPILATTDAEGRYSFESIPEGLCIIQAKDPQVRFAECRRLVSAVKGKPCTLDFGGPVSVGGTVVVGGSPLTNKVLLLSDQFNVPQEGVFVAETTTDARGSFLFTGVPAGVYGIYSPITANRWTLLGQVETGTVDIMMALEEPTVKLTIKAEAIEEPLQIVAVSLRYHPISPDTLAEWTGIRTEVDSIYEINGVLPGVYTLCVDLSNGVRMLRDITVTTQPQQDVICGIMPLGTAELSGRFLSSSQEGLTLSCDEPMMEISVMPQEDGGYELRNLPSAVYRLGTIINQMFVPYLEVGLFEEQPAVFDPDPQAMEKTRSPLYVYVTDAQGRGLAGGQVWMTGEAGLYTGLPFGRGFFIAAPPGQYMLYAVFAGYSAFEQQVTLAVSNLRAGANESNTVVVRLEK